MINCAFDWIKQELIHISIRYDDHKGYKTSLLHFAEVTWDVYWKQDQLSRLLVKKNKEQFARLIIS